MQKTLAGAIAAATLVGVAATAWAGPDAEKVTVLWGERTEAVENVIAERDALWIPTADLERVTGFTLKEQGACIDEICVPVPRTGDEALVATQDGVERIDLIGFAKRNDQAIIKERGAKVYGFGLVPSVRDASVGRGRAPELTLKDRTGKPVNLSDFRGKKVLLFTWASW